MTLRNSSQSLSNIYSRYPETFRIQLGDPLKNRKQTNKHHIRLTALFRICVAMVNNRHQIIVEWVLGIEMSYHVS